jgi:hypothetical protein
MGTIIMFYERHAVGLMQNRKKQQKNNWNSSECDKKTAVELQCSTAVGFVSEAVK